VIYVLSTIPTCVIIAFYFNEIPDVIPSVGILWITGDAARYCYPVQLSYVHCLLVKFKLMGIFQMATALVATGWWMYIDVAQTPNAVVVCVIVFNAAFGYSWGPIPWLYPPEVRRLNDVQLDWFLIGLCVCRLCRSTYGRKGCRCRLRRIGHSIFLLERSRHIFRISLHGVCTRCMGFSVFAVLF
jgi:hypothetical protein